LCVIPEKRLNQTAELNADFQNGGHSGGPGPGVREKRGPGWELRGPERGFPRWRQAGETGEDNAILCNNLQSKKRKETRANNNRAGTIQEEGSLISPAPPPPPPFFHFLGGGVFFWGGGKNFSPTPF